MEVVASQYERVEVKNTGPAARAIFYLKKPYKDEHGEEINFRKYNDDALRKKINARRPGSQSAEDMKMEDAAFEELQKARSIPLQLKLRT